MLRLAREIFFLRSKGNLFSYYTILKVLCHATNRGEVSPGFRRGLYNEKQGGEREYRR